LPTGRIATIDINYYIKFQLIFRQHTYLFKLIYCFLGSSVCEATNSDSAIDPLGVNFPPGDAGGGGVSDTVQDIFASGIPLDVPLAELGLGGYTPVGLIHGALDFLHLTLGLPWWGAIVAGTIVFRALVFPIMIKGQINSAKLAAVKPELERLQENLREMSNYQNPMMKAQASVELQQLFKKHDCHPAKVSVFQCLSTHPTYVYVIYLNFIS